ncbi:MAG: YceI family protein [Betaproteobacteria bacterium]|nr:YceI family protein [Betaproteobacteria bacterium]
MKSPWGCLGGVLLSCQVLAAPVTVVDLAKSEIKFVSKQMNVPVDGVFKKFDVQFFFDPDKLASSKALLSVDIGSIDTGSTEGDAEVQRKPWFNTKEFPKATFMSSAIKSLGSGRYEVSGKLTIKGKSKDVAAPFTAKTVAGGTTLEGGFTLLRSDFGIGEGPWSDPETVAEEVQVKFKFLGRAK